MSNLYQGYVSNGVQYGNISAISLQVTNNGLFTPCGIAIRNTFANPSRLDFINSNITGGACWTIINNNDGTTSNDLRILSNAGGTTVMTMLQNGNVGIGTVVPINPFEVWSGGTNIATFATSGITVQNTIKTNADLYLVSLNSTSAIRLQIFPNDIVVVNSGGMTINSNYLITSATGTNLNINAPTGAGIYFKNNSNLISYIDANGLSIANSAGEIKMTVANYPLILTNNDVSSSVNFKFGTTTSCYVNVNGLNINTPNKGIKFYNSSALINSILNDYEEGTFTTTWGGQTGTPPSFTIVYTKVGRMVHFTYLIGVSTFSGTSTSFYFTLPFPPAQTSVGCWANGGQNAFGSIIINPNGYAYPSSFSLSSQGITLSGTYPATS